MNASRQSGRQRRRMLLLLAAVLVIAGAWWWRSSARPAAPSHVTAPVTRGDVEETVLATGSLRPSRLVAVGSQVSGRVLSVKHKVGDLVRKGELVAQIDSVTQENKLRTAEADLARLRAQREEKLASLKLAEQTLERQKVMVARNAISRTDYDRASAEVDVIRAQIAALEAQITSGEIAVADARANLAYTQIVAPIDGAVLAVVTQEGQTVSAIQSAPTIVILGQLDTMAVNAQISEADVVKVKPGQKVRFSIIGEPGRQQTVTLESIDPAPESIRSDAAISSSAASSSTATTSAIYYNGVFHVPNPDGRLRTYMTANAHIILGEAKNVLTVPAAALRRAPDGRGQIVRVLEKDGKVAERRVEVGLNDKVTAEIRTGLDEGERVILDASEGGPAPGAGRSLRRRSPMGF